MKRRLKRTVVIGLGWIIAGEIINDVYDCYTPAQTYRQKCREANSATPMVIWETVKEHVGLDLLWPGYIYASTVVKRRMAKQRRA